MKIASFHKQRGDKIRFVKGLNEDVRKQRWDRIYITTLFSFYWTDTIKTLRYYDFTVKDPRNVFIGGPMATLMADEIQMETGFKPVKGLLDKKGQLRLSGDHKVDSISPDYSILDETDYKYPVSNAYFAYMTRGCVRKCPFCAVPKIEPFYVDYISLINQVERVNDKYGEKKDLLLLDNNVLASPKFDQIIDEIKKAGFYKGAKLNNSLRHVDFNQGIDLRLLTKEKMERLAELPIHPLRIAFDHIGLKDKYIEKIEWAAEHDFIHLSNYILYNYEDIPEEFYERLRINVDLNEKLGTQIYSFPMKYIPVTSKDRGFVGKHWTPKCLRSIQCILQATHGVVSPRREFFEAAFGKNMKEFKKLLILPEDYIIYRADHKNDGTGEWNDLLRSLNANEKNDFLEIVRENRFDDNIRSKFSEVNELLRHYSKDKWDRKDSIDRTFKDVLPKHKSGYYGLGNVTRKGYYTVMHSKKRDLRFPHESIGGLANEFAELYSSHYAAPFGFWALDFLVFMGCLITPEIKFITGQPSRFFLINVGKRAVSHKSTAMNETREFFRFVWNRLKVTSKERTLYEVERELAAGHGIPAVFIEHGDTIAQIRAKRTSRFTKKLVLLYDDLKGLAAMGNEKGNTLFPELAKLFENEEYVHTTRGKGRVSLFNLHTSLITNGTAEVLQETWKNNENKFGLPNRFFLAFDESYKPNYDPMVVSFKEKDNLAKKVATCLDGFLKERHGGDGKERYIDYADPTAKRAYLDWCEDFFNKHGDDDLTGCLDALGWGLMSTMAVCEGTWKVTVDLVTRVIKLLEQQYRVRYGNLPVDGGKQVATMANKIRRYLEEHPGSTIHETENGIHSDRYGGARTFNWAFGGLKDNSEIASVGKKHYLNKLIESNELIMGANKVATDGDS